MLRDLWIARQKIEIIEENYDYASFKWELYFFLV